ncbi:MAG: hypothetical protein JXJ20_07030 [Anaerolineae bacterium]|jgi:predicted  nucleic acid-binding Zn-ribbon protein|nr:hypothetical protein [Anaerolineae bacterium]
MSQIPALYRLQRIDLDLDARRQRLREITAELEEDSALRQAQAEVKSLRDALTPQEARITDLNLEIQTVTTQREQFTDRLYGGKVSNPKELQDLQGKVAELKRRRAQLEDKLLETMIKVEELQEALVTATRRLEQVQADLSMGLENLTKEQQRLKREVKDLKADREAAVRAIPADNLELYKTLRSKKRGHAVAVLEGDMCSCCHVSQTTVLVQQVRQGQEMVMCASCGRILVAI